MNAPANLPQPPREDALDAAHRQAISIHCPNIDPTEMATRVELAKMRDAAVKGMSEDISDAAIAVLDQVMRLAMHAVYAPLPTSRLLRIRFALWMLMEGARAVERVQRDG